MNTQESRPEQDANLPIPTDWLIGGGEMGELIRSMDWSATPLGSRDAWPLSLRTVVNLVLSSSCPMAILWGNEWIFIYNDGCRIIFAGSQPKAMGRSIREVWPESWEFHKLIFERVMARRETEHLEDQPLRIVRQDCMEDVYFTISYSPIRTEDSQISGALVVLMETTQRVSSEQQLKLANETLAAKIASQKRLEEVLRESEEKFLGTFETNPIPTAISTFLEGRFLNVNDAFLEVFSYSSKAELIGKTSLELGLFANPHERQFTRRAVEEKGRVHNKEMKMVAKDGRVLDCLFSAIPIFISNKQYLLTTGVDITDHKLAEEKLREITGRLHLATASVKAGVWDWNIQTNEMIWDDRMLELYGFTQENFPGGVEAWEKGLHPDDFSTAIQESQAALRGERDYDTEFRILRPDGRVVFIKANGLVLRDEEGKPLRMIGLNTDITESKLAEVKLRESEVRFRTIIDSSPVAMAINDERKNITFLNRKFLETFGYTLADIPTVAAWWPRAYPDPEYRERIMQEWQAALEKAGKDDCAVDLADYEVKCKDGTVRNIHFSVAPIGTAHVVIFHDITERKCVEEALLASNEMFSLFMRHSPIYTFIKELSPTESRVLQASDNFRQMIGIPGQEMIGKTMGELFPAEFAAKITADDWSVVEKGEVLELDEDLNGRNYTSIKFPIVKRDKTLLAGYTIDITERKVMEAQLHQAQKLESVGRLAGGVAHDFNNMLGVILGHAEMALGQVGTSQPLHDHLEEIRKAASRSADLTRQLLAFARKQTIAPKVLDLNETVAGMLKMLRRLIGEDIDLNWLPGPDLWPVKLDPSQIDQILANLCVNSRDAISNIGWITIETGNITLDEEGCALHQNFVPGEYVRLKVEDNGCGMNQETLNNIFEPFFTTKGTGRGTGLGLSTVYGAVKQNNGFIDVRSEPGQGTTFTIYLPRHVRKTGQERAEGGELPIKRGHETILLVEDYPAMLKATQRMLEMQGYTVLATSTPSEAIRLAGEHAGEVHLLMTDVVMPGMNGQDLAKTLLSIYPKLRSLFMSGYTADVISTHGVLDEKVCFIQKPFSAQNLAAKMREALENTPH